MADRPRHDPADAVVVFGASGDLARKNIFLALYTLCRDGPIDGLRLPRLDAGACFVARLGGSEHGRWLIAPAAADAARTRRG